MRLLKLEEDSLRTVFRTTESGMDFAIVTGDCNSICLESAMVVRGNGYAILIERYENIYTLVDMNEGKTLPDEYMSISLSNIAAVSALTSITLPKGYLPARGAHQLLGTMKLRYDTRFFRFTSNSTDYKFSANNISNDTYLTTENDRHFVNSGFGAVGRYALPMPLPASYQHDYTIPAGTQLLVGTVAPQFGQAGGGVEVKTISTVSGVVLNVTTQIDDC